MIAVGLPTGGQLTADQITTSERKRIWILLALVALILCGVLRSAIATRLDAFTIDEPYHIAAGVSYLRLGDYRLNPEHPPLVKTWVALFLPRGSFTLPPLPALSDKVGERHFTSETVFLRNDPDKVQRRARLAMFVLNGILLFSLGLAVWRVFSAAMALAAIAFLVIDPTVAAHWPVVMTDLPVALLATTAVLLAWVAFHTWHARDLTLAGLALGLAWGAKHSAPVVIVAITVFGCVLAWRGGRAAIQPGRVARFGCVLSVIAIAWVLLWGLYGFRFNESPSGHDLFNRPLANKISDLRTPLLRKATSAMEIAHLLPRSYLWGLADTLRAGVEGRSSEIYFWNHRYLDGPPLYFFPVIIFIKLPIGLTVLAFLGSVLFVFGRVPESWKSSLVMLAAFALLFLCVLAAGNSQYAGVRHALPVFPPIAIFGAAAVVVAFALRQRVLLVAVCIASAAALFSAIPVLRPWEYYNEIAGGSQNACLHFSDEGIDLGQRTKELAAYYHSELEPRGDLPYLDYYFLSDEQYQARGIRSMQMLWAADPSKDNTDVIRGTLVANARWLRPSHYFDDFDEIRASQPVRRFGNLLVYRGTFHLPKKRSLRLAINAFENLYSPKPDKDKAERLLREAAALNPVAYGINLELGNLLAARGAREEAIRAYETARQYVPKGDAAADLLTQQIERVKKEDPRTVPPLRNPGME